MNKVYRFSKNEENKIINNFNTEFFLRTKENINNIIDIWEIISIHLIDSYSANLVFKCDSKRFGKTVIKVGRNSKEFSSEIFALEHFDGDKLCKLYDIDFERIMLLEECIEPGNVLRKESSLDKRLSVFASLYEGLHKEAIDADKFPSYRGWINNIADYMSHQEEHVELYHAMEKAKKLYESLSKMYSKKYLLHGDFHHDNILLDSNDSYRIIDPKGVIGDPIFDIPRFILNEFWFEPKTDELKLKVNYIISELSKMLCVPVDVLKKCTFIETIMGTCWWIEDGASSEEYKNLMETVVFVEELLES